VAKVNAWGTALDYCGYIGGNSSDTGEGIAVDSSGNAYVVGVTRSAEDTFPIVAGPDLTYNNPGLDAGDAFVAKINPAGSALIYCGYIGGLDSEGARGIAVDGSGNAYVVGTTWSSEATFPVVSGPDLTYNDFGDAFVAKVDSSGRALVYCGYIGSSGFEEAWGIAVDGFGDAYVAGKTESDLVTFPAVTGPDLTYNGGSGDAFVAKIKEVPVLVTSPNGGESWPAGSVHNVTWRAAGTIANVKLEYSASGGTTWTAIAASTANTGSYAWTVANAPSANCLVRVSDATNAAVFDVSNAVFTIGAMPPAISLSHTRLNYGAVAGDTAVKTQSVMISNSGGGTLNWSAASDQFWLDVMPKTGTGTGVFQVSVNPAGLAAAGMTAGAYQGTITVTDPNASNSPRTITVNLTVYAAGSTSIPFGDFATPVSGTTGITGAIPVTGWVLDDIEVTGVQVKRLPHATDPNGAIGPDGLVFIGDGLFVEGARPDVEAGYPTFPFNYRAGWGYMLLTNFLPLQGNDTFTLYAIATDREGNTVSLGTKTITCANASATKPFGTIDTPAQGGSASGNTYVNFGWVLAPQPKTVPKDGSTIEVYVDSVKVGTLATAPNVYDQYRVDVATAFPGLKNTGGPVGAFYLNTTTYTDGVHTIFWIATDDAGQADGIGSRYFNVVNLGAAQQGERPALRVGDELRPLPIGSTLDSHTGIFSWLPGPGFLGTYDLIFLVKGDPCGGRKIPVRLTVKPKF